MAGCEPSSFFACLWTETDKLAKKKERGQYPAILTEQTLSIKDLLYGLRGNFSCGTRRVVLRVANNSVGFDSSRPLTELGYSKNTYVQLLR